MALPNPPLGATRYRVAVILLLGLGFAATAGAASRSAAEQRIKIRQTIQKNLHFSSHCWCTGPDERTVQAVLKIATESDVPIVKDLLIDSNEDVAAGASLILQEWANGALDSIRAKLSTEDLNDPDFLKKSTVPAIVALMEVEATSPASGDRGPWLNAMNRLVEINAREEVARKAEITRRGQKAGHSQ